MRQGQPEAPYFEMDLDVSAASLGTAVGRGQVLVTNLDCDPDLDVVMPSDEGLVLLVNDGAGTLTPSTVLASELPVHWAAAGDLDHDDDDDLVASREDGTFLVWENDCGTFAAPDVYGAPLIGDTYEQTRIAVGRVCPGHPNSLAVVVGLGDKVEAYCGSGSGSFADIVEPHGEQTSRGADYVWEFSDAQFTNWRIADLLIDGGADGPQNLFALDRKEMSVLRLPPDSCGMDSVNSKISLGYPHAAPTPLSRFFSVPTSNDPTTWERILVLGGYGLQVLK